MSVAARLYCSGRRVVSALGLTESDATVRWLCHDHLPLSYGPRPRATRARRRAGLRAPGTADLPRRTRQASPHRHGFKDASTDEAQIQAWWGRWAHASIATPTGPDWFALDDDTNGEAIAQLEAEHEPLPPTVEVVTPRPGLHRYLLGSVTNSAGALPAGLDVRGTGGYVVLPPSSGYEFRAAPDEVPVAPAPAWLLTLLTSPANGTGAGEHDAPLKRVPHGQRHPYLTDFAVRLVRAGVTDRARLLAYLRLEFGIACAQRPPPAPRYFAELVDWALDTRIADRERDRADLAEYIRTRREEPRP